MIKQWIDQWTRWLSDRTLSISIMILMATALWIGVNIFYTDFSAVDLRALRREAKQFGEMAFLFAVLAFAYYGVREFYTYGRKKFSFIVKQQKNFLFFVTVLRRLHIWFGVLALAFMLDHGYLFLASYGGNLTKSHVQTGLVTFVLMVALVSFGILLKRSPAISRFRISHRFGALLLFVGYLLHKMA